MSISYESSRIAWLAAALAGHRDRIVILLRRLTGFDPRAPMNPSVFRKFLILLDQVAVAREKEIRILGRIEAAEQEHRFRRAHHQFEPVEIEEKEAARSECASEAEAARPGLSLLWLLILWRLFGCRAINQKKQGLTVD